MNFKKFLQNGVLAVVMAATVTNALAQPISVMQDRPERTEIVQIVKDTVPKEDLAYLIQNGAGYSDARTEGIYAKINETMESRYGNSEIQAIKKDLEKELKEIGAYKNIKVSYSWAMPKEIIQEYKDAKQNDSSAANNAMDISGTCNVVMKLAVDNQGRFFEASELAGLTTEQISARSDKAIKDVLKETISHEMSHCVLQEQMKAPDFEMSFSSDFVQTNPQIAKALNEKINLVKQQIANKDFDNINYFDYLMYSNYNENFADVSGAFARLGEHPSPEKIQEIRENLLEVARFRESTGLTHKTQAAVQYALEKLDDAAKMTPDQRIEFAKEIAGESLLSNMKIVFNKMFKSSDAGLVGSFLVGGLKLAEDGSVTQAVPEEKSTVYETIADEYDAMENAGHKLGSAGQKIFSHQELLAKYESKAPANEPVRYTFNMGNVILMRENALALDGDAKKVKAKMV